MCNLVNSKKYILDDFFERITSTGPTKFTDYEQQFNEFIEQYNKRNNFTKTLSWAVPSHLAINEIMNFAAGEEILEIGSGLGLWCHLLKLIGCNIIATDNFSSHIDKHQKKFCDIEEIDAIDAMQKYKDCNIFMLILPPMTSMAYDSLKLFKGNKFVYIGENDGGCNADCDFFELLEKEWKLEKLIEIPKWIGVNDSLYIYKKNIC